MAIERTLSIIKPDATERNLTGQIIALIEAAGLRMIAQKRICWRRKAAEEFYEVHKAPAVLQRPGDLHDLRAHRRAGARGRGRHQDYRDVMGATNPANAAPGTIRKEFAENIERNSVHGSDSPENAKKEIRACFKKSEIVGLGERALLLSPWGEDGVLRARRVRGWDFP